MAPLPEDSTARYRFDYTVNGEPHDFQIRASASPAAVGILAGDLLTTMAPELYALNVVSVSHAASGSGIFLPVTTGIEGNTYGTGTGAYEQKAWYVDFIGRSTAGRRWRLALFGIRTLAGDFRYLPGENATITSAIAVLNAAGVGELLAIDGADVVVYPYANAGVNAHWQRALRP